MKIRAIQSILSLLLLSTPSVAAPAIADPTVTGIGWTMIGGGGTATVDFSNSQANILGGQNYALVIGRTATGANEAAFFDGITSNPSHANYISPSFYADIAPPTGQSFNSPSRLVGAYQSFSLTTGGNISFDAVAFSSRSSGQTQPGDPFVFLYNTDIDQGIFWRGGTHTINLNGIASAVSGSLPDADATINLAPGNRPTGYSQFTQLANSSGGLAGTTYTFENVITGNYVIGFGFGSSNTANTGTATWGGFAVTNFQSPEQVSSVPEIDANSAAMPLVLSFMLLLLAGDRSKKTLLAIQKG